MEAKDPLDDLVERKLAWVCDSEGPWTVERWIAGLRKRGVCVDEEGFRVEGRIMGGPHALVEAWDARMGPFDLSDGFIAVAAFELWQELLPGEGCPELLLAVLAGLGLMDGTVDESKWLTTACREVMALTTMARRRAPDAPMDWIERWVARLGTMPLLRWIGLLPERLVAAGRRREAMDVCEAWLLLFSPSRKRDRFLVCPCGSGIDFRQCCGR